MKKEHIMDAMDYIDPALVAAADAPAPRRGKVRWLRPALAAACLCLALAGTAVAAQVLGVRVDLQPNPVLASHFPGYAVYNVQGGFACIPADSFSQEVRELPNQGLTHYGCDKYFGDWDELEQFLGWDLLDNPLLDTYKTEVTRGYPGHIVLTAHANDLGLCYIRVDDGRPLDGVSVSRSSRLYTDNAQEGDFDLQWLESTRPYSEDSRVTETEYTTPSGLTATVIEVIAEKPAYQISPHFADAYFSFNGVRYNVKVSAYSNGDGHQVMEVLKTVLDSFVLD